jgi:hypothetical protein
LAEAADENFDLFTDAANRFLPVSLLMHMHGHFFTKAHSDIFSILFIEMRASEM